MENDDHHKHLSLFPNSLAELCFDRAEFNRPDFNVDSFLAKARRRGASLEQIRDDARTYLKIIQNSMIELINQDYADFVHLSSNLAGLRGAVEKLGLEVDELASEFESTSSKIEAAVVDLAKEYDDKQRLCKEQQDVERSIAALSTLERLKKLFSSPHFSDSSSNDQQNICHGIRRASYFVEELYCVKNSCSTLKIRLHSTFERSFFAVIDHFQKWLESKFVVSVENGDHILLVHVLRGFAACDRLDAARATFLAHFVEPELRSCLGSKKQKLGKLEQFKFLLDQMIILQNRFRPVFGIDTSKRNQISEVTNLDDAAWGATSSFLDDCLLMSLSSCLQDRFSSILIPTDASTFRKAYSFLTAFAEQWSTSSGGNKILKMIFDKFSLLVYYQLHYHDVTSSVDSTLASSGEPLRNGDATFLLKSTSLIYAKLLLIWDDQESGLFLPPLSSKCWELTCMIVNRYGRHVLDAVGNFKKYGEADTPSNRLLTNGDQSAIPKRASTPTFSSSTQRSHSGDATSEMAKLLISYSSDAKNLKRLVCDDLFRTILNRCKLSDEAIGTSLRQCLEETFSNSQQNIDHAIAEALIPWLTVQVSNQLATVVEVPRQYRWTRKEAPTQPSPYLSAALDPIRRLSPAGSDAPDLINSILERVFSSVVSSYTENLKSVLESVEKISSSLNRLKTKGSGKPGATPENVGAVTDEQKIRLQLRLDVEEFEKLIGNFSPPVICDLSEMKSLIAFNLIGGEA